MIRVDIDKTLRRALQRLESEQARIQRQITGLRNALQALQGGASANGVGRGSREESHPRRSAAGRGRRRGMSAAARKAVSIRMKAYWAKRRAKNGAKATAGKARKKSGA